MGNLLKGKVAIVTGSGRGIGRAHAVAMVAQGAKVVVNDPGFARDGTSFDKSPADQVVAELKGKGGEAVANYDSVATSEGAVNIIKTAIDNFGRLDILVNNAGVRRHNWSWEMTDEEWDTVIKGHLYGTFYCAREAIKIFRQQQSGRIINTSSSAGFGGAEMSSYSAAKEGIVGLTRTLARELGSYGITANCIRPAAGTREIEAPGWVERVARRVGREEAEKMLAAQLKRTPEGCTAIVVFLASDVADNVNGCIFWVRLGEVSIYRDPPYLEQRLWKKGNWTPEELVELLPKTLTRGKVRELPWGPDEVTSR
ncbi:SDR family NAD(P)-dependent oxidoreductase [Chloroflexota bacterium]